MVTHDPRYADQAERTIHLFDGRTVRGAENMENVALGSAEVAEHRQ